MATIDFESAVGRVHFDGGTTDEGKLIRKSKTYRNIAAGRCGELVQRARGTCKLSSMPFIECEKVETSGVNN